MINFNNYEYEKDIIIDKHIFVFRYVSSNIIDYGYILKLPHVNYDRQDDIFYNIRLIYNVKSININKTFPLSYLSKIDYTKNYKIYKSMFTTIEGLISYLYKKYRKVTILTDDNIINDLKKNPWNYIK
jgi:hypothetical protein